MDYAFDVTSKKSLSNSESQKFSYIFSRSLIVMSGFMFRSVINFEYIFLHGVRYESNSYFYIWISSSSKHTVLKTTTATTAILSSLNYLCTLSKICYPSVCGLRLYSLFRYINLFAYSYTKTTVLITIHI